MHRFWLLLMVVAGGWAPALGSAWADDFDRLEGPPLAAAAQGRNAEPHEALRVAELGRLPRILPGVRSAVLVVRTNEGNPARLIVSAAFRRPAAPPESLKNPAGDGAPPAAAPTPILVLERFDTFEAGPARSRLAHGRDVILFDGFEYDLDTAQVVPAGQGGDLRFRAEEGGWLQAIAPATLFTLKGSPLSEQPEPGSPSPGSKVLPTDFAGHYRLFANGQLSGALELTVEQQGTVAGRFRSDQTGASYPVTGQVDRDRPEWLHFAIQFPRSRQEYEARLWTEGKGALTGTVNLLERDFGFFAIRENGRIRPDDAAAAIVPGADGRPNVLLITIDDLNDWIGCLKGHPQVQTPNMDRLARRGTLFTNAHCQAPLCNPSRTSFLTGLRPSTTGVYALDPWFRTSPRWKDHVTMPQYFMKHHYQVLTCGKIFHDAYPPPQGRQPGTEFSVWGYHGNAGPRPPKKFVTTPDPNPLVDWGIYPDRDELQEDSKIADWAIERLGAKLPEPFLLSVGFRRPHVPCYAPKKWFDLYPIESVLLPPVLPEDRDDTPRFSWYLHWSLPEPRLKWLESAGQWKALVQAYLASTSFVDGQVGRVLDALEASGQADNTIVVLLSDHGWHLGEKLITGKNTLWDRSTRVPLIIAGPGISSGAVCKQPVELLDLYPTLVQLCGLPEKPDLEGHSLVPQLKDAATTRAWPAITTHGPDNHGVRSERYRYIRYADGSEELYDLEADPNEWKNRAGDPALQEIQRELAAWMPKSSAPPLPGSKARLIELRQGVPFWEGKPIDPEQSPP